MTEPTAEPEINPARIGPYDATTNGRCADGHPLNAYGRCAEDNAEEYPNG